MNQDGEEIAALKRELSSKQKQMKELELRFQRAIDDAENNR